MSDRILVFDDVTVLGENVSIFFTNPHLVEFEATAFVPPDYLEITGFLTVFTALGTERLLPLRSVEDNTEVFNVGSTLYAINLPEVPQQYNCNITVEMDIATPLRIWITTRPTGTLEDIIDRLDAIVTDGRNNSPIPLAGLVNSFLLPSTPTLLFNAAPISNILDYWLVSNVSSEPIILALDRIPSVTDYDFLIPPGETTQFDFVPQNVYAINTGGSAVNVNIQAFE